MITFVLRQGSTVIATRDIADVPAITAPYEFDLTAPELALITDPTALEVEVTAGQIGERIYFLDVLVGGTPVQITTGAGQAGLALGTQGTGTVFLAQIDVSLYQGAVLIATWTISNPPASWTDYEFQLTGGQLAQITDPNQLEVRLVAGESTQRVASLDVVLSGTTISLGQGAGTATLTVGVTAVGVVAVVGQGGGLLTMSINASGVVTAPNTRVGDGTVLFSLSSTGTGRTTVTGIGAPSLVVRSTGAGTSVVVGSGSALVSVQGGGTATITGLATRFGVGLAVITARTSGVGTVSVAGSGSAKWTLRSVAFGTTSQVATIVPDGVVTNAGWTPVGAASLQAALAVGDADYMTAGEAGAVATVTLSDPPTALTLTGVILTIRART